MKIKKKIRNLKSLFIFIGFMIKVLGQLILSGILAIYDVLFIKESDFELTIKEINSEKKEKKDE